MTQVLSAIKSASVNSFLPGVGFGAVGGGIIAAIARPAGGRGICKRNDCLFHDGGQKVKHGKNQIGKIFGFLIAVGVFGFGLYGVHL
jgi:hypothetical protein